MAFRSQRITAAIFLCLALQTMQAQRREVAAPKATLVTVEPGVRVEVLDWGGTGRPLVFLAGLGGTAHSYDTFALNFTGKFHVYGITRRGYAPSDVPAPIGDNYASDRLGNDVISVLDHFQLKKPVLVGHSIAGEELSSIGSRSPDRVGGLIYLDAAFRYAFSPIDRGDFQIDTLELKKRLNDITKAISPAESRVAVKAALDALPQYEKDLAQQKSDLDKTPDMAPAEYEKEKAAHTSSEGLIEDAIQRGERRYTSISCPVLAIFALPHDLGIPPGPKRDRADAREIKYNGFMADDFQAGVPAAHIVKIPHAKHEIYVSNEAQVVQEMNTFLAGLQ